MRDLYVILVNGQPTYRETMIRTYKTLKGAMREAAWNKKYRPDVQVVRLTAVETLEVPDAND